MANELKFIITEDKGDGIRRIILNRPEKRNALSNSLRKELFSCLEEADQEQEVRVIVISGAGTCFSSGYDLSSVIINFNSSAILFNPLIQIYNTQLNLN